MILNTQKVSFIPYKICPYQRYYRSTGGQKRRKRKICALVWGKNCPDFPKSPGPKMASRIRSHGIRLTFFIPPISGPNHYGENDRKILIIPTLNPHWILEFDKFGSGLINRVTVERIFYLRCPGANIFRSWFIFTTSSASKAKPWSLGADQRAPPSDTTHLPRERVFLGDSSRPWHKFRLEPYRQCNFSWRASSYLSELRNECSLLAKRAL